MEWTRYSTGSDFENNFSYSRALHDDEWVFVSGTTGFDYTTMELSDDPAEQARQTLRNVAGALENCGSSLAEVYSYLLIVSDRSHVPTVLGVLANAFPGKPTGTLMVAGLLEERINVELEVRARKGWNTPT
jgi:enamine deaminase RidA (YjgF/YER057c/UK114 family)